MNTLNDIVTYVRRIIKSPSNDSVSTNLIIDYINRFWINDVDARIQLFDLKSKYQFQTAPGYDQYNMPMYSLQSEPGNQTVSYYPVYQGFEGPAFINGIQVPFQTQKSNFFNIWPNVVQNMQGVTTGNNGTTYSFTMPISPNNSTPLNTPLQYILRGHVDVSGCLAITQLLGSSTFVDPPIVNNTQAQTTIPGCPVANVFPSVYITAIGSDGSSIVVCDSGQFLEGDTNYGLLMQPGKAPLGNLSLGTYSTTSNTINYLTGEVNVTFPTTVSNGVNINAQCFLFQCGLPRSILFNNNTLLFRSPPDQQYLVEIDAYLTPAAFLASTDAVKFGYMSEYIARGAARKMLSDTGDMEQFQFYEPFFREQEMLVWKRSQRQFTSTRTGTIYSNGINQGQQGYNAVGGSTA